MENLEDRLTQIRREVREERRESMQYAWSIAKPVLQYTEKVAVAGAKLAGLALLMGAKGIGIAAKATANAAVSASETYDRARRYEELDPESAYQTPEADENEKKGVEKKFEQSREAYMESMNKYKEANSDDAQEKLKQAKAKYNKAYSDRRKLRWKSAGRNVASKLRRIGNIGENSRKYTKLEQIAEKLSEERKEEISPETVYHQIQYQKLRKAQEEELTNLRKQLNTYLRRSQDHPELKKPTYYQVYNELVERHNNLCEVMGIASPWEYYQPIIF